MAGAYSDTLLRVFSTPKILWQNETIQGGGVGSSASISENMTSLFQHETMASMGRKAFRLPI
jgi:hypothetical protein